MKVYRIGRVCARAAFAFVLGVLPSAHVAMAGTAEARPAASPKRYVHWTFKPASSDRFASITIDKPAVINTESFPHSLCATRGYERDHCITGSVLLDPSHSKPVKCACAIVWTFEERGHTVWRGNAHAGRMSVCREEVKTMTVLYGPVVVKDVDEVCPAAGYWALLTKSGPF